MEGISPPVRSSLDTTNKGYNKTKKSNTPPSSSDAYGLDVIQFPSSKRGKVNIDRVTIPLVKVDTGEGGYGDYKDLEKELGSIPNLREWKGTPDFKWSHRTLVRLPAKELGPGGEDFSEDLLMYTCTDQASNLPRNGHVERLAGYSETPVYGDVFIFSMKPWVKESDRSEGAKWVHMPDFLAEIKCWYYRYDFDKLLKLLRLLPKPEKDEEK